MWVIVGGQESDSPYQIYDFKDDGSHHHVLNILTDYREALHSDKFGADEKLAQQKAITWHPCWVHNRRKFFEAGGVKPSVTGFFERSNICSC